MGIIVGTMRTQWRKWTAADAPPTGNDGAIDSEAERALRMFGAPEPGRFAESFNYRSPPGPGRRAARERARAPFTVFLPGLIIGGLAGYALTVDDPRSLMALPARAYAVFNGSPYYLNCAQARMFGAAPLYRGQPGYSKRLDTDHNGVACEPFFGKPPPPPAKGKH